MFQSFHTLTHTQTHTCMNTSTCTYTHFDLQGHYQLLLFSSITSQLLILLRQSWFLVLYQLRLEWQ